MGTGLHCLNGAGPEVALLQYETYVLPTLMYGLEALCLSTSEVSKLSTFHCTNLRFIQHLPKSTAIPTIHLLSGSPPFEALLHICILLLFRTIADADLSIPPARYMKELIASQLAMKDIN